MASKTFSAQIDKFISDNSDALSEVMKRSTQDLIIEASTVIPKGGNMPLDTGFLRASGRISFSGMPSGPTRGDLKTKEAYPDNTGTTVLEIAKMTTDGPALFFGWTAKYAKYQEAKRMFLASAVQNWQDIVTRNANAVKKELGK